MAKPETTLKHPKGLYLLFFTEMWERFGFYLMIGIFYQYLVDSQKGGMGWSGTKAAGVVGSYLAFVYLTPFLGGILADRLLGCRVTISAGATLMAAGYFMLMLPGETSLYLALLVLIIGNGLFKPNISTLVGRLYPPGSPLRDAGYNIFYLGINIGAFFCNFAAAIARNIWGWPGAFATAGVGMLIGLVAFVVGQKLIAHADVSPRKRVAQPGEEQASLIPLFAGCLLPAAVLFGAGYYLGGLGEDHKGFLGLGPATTGFLFACLPVIGFYIWVWRSIPNAVERGRVAGLLAIYGVVIVFWAVFHQNSTALTEWALHSTDRTPSAAVRPIINLSDEFAENAPPEYFKNAPADTPRPDKSTYRLVSKEEYEQLKRAKQLSVEEGKTVPVTQEMFDAVYAKAGPTTKTLPPGEHLKLVNTELFQSINPGFIILLTPVVVGFFGLLRRRGKEPSTPAKIGLGLAITSLSTVVMIAAAQLVDDTVTKGTAWWLFGTYGIITIGELCLSPMGLSLISKMSPKRITSFMMGGWFLSTSMGNKLSGVMGEKYLEWSHTKFFVVNMALTGVAALAIFALLPWLRRQMNEDHDAAAHAESSSSSSSSSSPEVSTTA
jgi:POT family proton-dependent oligopeptide transporter